MFTGIVAATGLLATDLDLEAARAEDSARRWGEDEAAE